MSDLDEELNQELADLRKRDLSRELRRLDSAQAPRIQLAGQEMLNFSSNDYLGLANHADLKHAAIGAVEQYGAGSGASRLVSGSLAPHHRLEEALAALKGTEAALSFSSGYATALGTICALLGKEDVIVIDRLAHASLVDAARLSGATLRVFAHNDLQSLDRILHWAVSPGRTNGSRRAARVRRILVVTESVFSMDGDVAPLRQLVELKERYGAWLMVDEAHATGLYGEHGSGLAEALDVDGRIDVQMGTLGKALGSAGGYICGSRPLVDLLIHRARSFIFSTAPPPAAAAAAAAAVAIVQREMGQQLRALLWERVAQLRAGLAALPELTVMGTDRAVAGRPCLSAIIPLMVGSESAAVAWAAALRIRGVLAPAIRYPTVGRGKARLRLTVTASHQATDVARLLAVLKELGQAPFTPEPRPE
jgi:8-amino-7-oxononanoate synthase